MKKAATWGGSVDFLTFTLSQPKLRKELCQLELQLAQRGCRHPEVVAYLLLQHRLTGVLDRDSSESWTWTDGRDGGSSASVSGAARNRSSDGGHETRIRAHSAVHTGARRQRC